MPIEIKELHIRVAVNAAQGASAGAGPMAGGGVSDDAKDAIVADCVEQVLQILQGKMER